MQRKLKVICFYRTKFFFAAHWRSLIWVVLTLLFAMLCVTIGWQTWPICSSRPEWFAGCAAAWQATLTVVLVAIGIGVPIRQRQNENARIQEEARRRQQSSALLFLPKLEEWMGFLSSAVHMMRKVAAADGAQAAMRLHEAPNLITPGPNVVAFVERFYELGDEGINLSGLILNAREIAHDIANFPYKRGHGRNEESVEDWDRIAANLIDRSATIHSHLSETRRLLRLRLGQAPF